MAEPLDPDEFALAMSQVRERLGLPPEKDVDPHIQSS